MVRSATGFTLFVLGAAAMAAAANETGFPRGPVFGNNGYLSEIRDEGATDTDDFVGPLAAGETLSVEVRVPPESALRPALALFDPTGAERTPPVKGTRDGRVVALRRFVADRTGTWVVRVLGREDSEGAYRVRFRVGAPRGPRARRTLLGGGAPRVEVLPFEAVRGSRLDLRFSGGPTGALPPYVEVLDPVGRSVGGGGSLLEREGRAFVVRGLPLDGPDGTWKILAGVDGGPETRPVSLAFRVDPVERPRGDVALDPGEPALRPRAAPLTATGGTLVRIAGRGFSEGPPPVVLLGGIRVPVISVAPGGGSLSLTLPVSAPEEPLEAVVVNPDGQACAAPAFVRVLPPAPPSLLSVDPLPVLTTAGSSRIVTLTLSGNAPATGARVELAVEGCDATVPITVDIPPYGTEGSFELLAGMVPGTGTLVASWGRTVETPVQILAAPGSATKEVDLSHWKIVQTSSARTFTLPPGTLLKRGGAIVVARNATQSAFEGFWGTTLGASVVYFNSGDQFPSLNGDETFTLVAPSGANVDGPTPKLVAGRNLQRLAGFPAGYAASWTDLAASPGQATPGTTVPGVHDGGIRITEIADPSASGQFIYEFVEITWDAPL